MVPLALIIKKPMMELMKQQKRQRALAIKSQTFSKRQLKL
nr:MAG TPA: hypothetical protein [Caudoviricetes sp.]